MSRSGEFTVGADPEKYWGQFYIEGMTESTEKALGESVSTLAQKHAQYPTDCGALCQTLQGELSKRGVKSVQKEGSFGAGLEPPYPMSRDHVWLEVDDHIVDPTAGQFRSQFKGDFSREHYRPYE